MILPGKIGKDRIELEQRGKGNYVYITAFVDQVGTEARVLKQQLIDWLWVR